MPRPISVPIYATEEPTTGDSVDVALADGKTVNLYFEVWRPLEADGNVPPEKLPALVVATPYGWAFDSIAANSEDAYGKQIRAFTSRGFAVVFLHVQGTGRSVGGCWDVAGRRTGEVVAAALEPLAKKDWSDGTFALYGISYDADTALATVTMADPPDALRSVITAAAMPAQYESDFWDGGQYGPGYTFATFGLAFAQSPRFRHPSQLAAHTVCNDELRPMVEDQSGNFNRFWQGVDYRPGAENIDVPTIITHGMADEQPEATDVFRRIPNSTPHVGLFGWWEHGVPVDFQRVKTSQARADFFDLVSAWLDRYLRGADTGVEQWPRVQVQGSDGQWRAERSWPDTGGPIGTLALGPAGTLGTTLPVGSTSYTEGYGKVPAPGTTAVFETATLTKRLQLTGRPVLDLWVTLDGGDATLAARLEVIGADGEPERYHANIGIRSAQYLDAFGKDGFFRQEQSRPVDWEQGPIRVPVRFDTADLVVPAGGKLRLIVAGSVKNGLHDQWDGNRDGETLYKSGDVVVAHEGGLPVAAEPFYYTAPSGSGTTVTIHHDCAHPSVLRFQLPSARPKLLDVRDIGEAIPTRKPPPSNNPAVESTGGGLATERVCGQPAIPPERLLRLGR